MAEEITITLAGADGYVGVATLIETLENTLKILHGLEPRFLPHEQIRWEIVRASMRSPLSLTLAPRTADAQTNRASRRVIRAYSHGIREISARPSLPSHFDEDSLNAAKELVEHATRDDATLTILVGDEEPITPSEAFVENVKQLVEKARTLYETGTIEGRLEVVSRHEKNSFFVWEALSGHKIECFATPEQFETAAEFIRNGVARLAVSGRIKYRSGRPLSVQVENIRRLRDASELPQLSDIGRIDITDELSSEEYVRRLRDAR